MVQVQTDLPKPALFALLKFTTAAASAAFAEGESGFAMGWSFCPRVLLESSKKLAGRRQIAVLKRSSDCGEIERSIRSKEGIILMQHALAQCHEVVDEC
jgi:hypothetical protein